MDVVIGITGKDYVMCIADMSSNRSIFSLKRDEEKIALVDERKFLAAGGDQASRSAFTDFVAKNFALNNLQTGLELSTHAAAHFIRKELAQAIRSRGGPHQANSLLGGIDEDGASLYHLDYLGSLEKVDFGAQGYCAYFSLSLMDRHWKKNMTVEEGRALMELCIEQLNTRFIINNPRYRLIAIGTQGKIIDEIIES